MTIGPSRFISAITKHIWPNVEGSVGHGARGKPLVQTVIWALYRVDLLRLPGLPDRSINSLIEQGFQCPSCRQVEGGFHVELLSEEEWTGVYMRCDECNHIHDIDLFLKKEGGEE